MLVASLHLIILFSMYGYFACVYVYVLYPCNACRVQKKVLEPLELEIHVVMSHHVCWDLRLVLVEEQAMLLTAGPSLQLRLCCFLPFTFMIK